MVVVVLGLDALDPEIVDAESHPNLALSEYATIETIMSSKGAPSTHEVWPSIITGLRPEEHGLLVGEGTAWGTPLLRSASGLANRVLPRSIRTKLGAWLLNNTSVDAFRVPASYYERNGIETMFDGRAAKAIGVPNYVTDPGDTDREHVLRQRMGDLFERDASAHSGHTSADPDAFYERCMEMAMVRIARTRRALRSGRFELVFGYTSALDLIGHVSFERPDLQGRAYEEIDEFVGELRRDLRDDDVLVLVSDHGLQEGLHTDEAMIASTDASVVKAVGSVLDLFPVLIDKLDSGAHDVSDREVRPSVAGADGDRVREQLEDLGYL